jgi:molybdopterin converting factor small subunit
LQLIRITIKLFGTYRELNSQRLLTLEMPNGATAGDVWRRLGEQTPRLRTVEPAVAINLEHAGLDQTLRDGDEVAFLPPVSGGEQNVKHQT